ncbi:hypothetical protein PIB30_071034, partial [Stylosanthes scabra]|nr:hypothetical protein [Stylosanthes scabra]
RNEYKEWIRDWLNRTPVWVPNYPPPVGVSLEDYISWHNGEYKDFLGLSAYDANEGQDDNAGEPDEQPEQSQ